MSEHVGQPTIVFGSRDNTAEFAAMNVAALLGVPIQRWYGDAHVTNKCNWQLRGRHDAGTRLKGSNIYRYAPGET